MSCNNTCQIGANLNVGVQEGTPFETPILMGISKIVANDGTTNKISLTTPKTEAYWTGLTANAEYNKRLNLLKLIDDFAEDPQDPEMQSASSGRNYRLRDGVVGYEFKIFNTDKTLFQALKSFERKTANSAYGMILADACGNVVGQKCGNDLNYVRISQGSFIVKNMNKTNEVMNHVLVRFELEVGVQNAYDVMLISNGDFNINKVEPLKDLELKAVVSTTTTNYTVDLVHRSANAMGIPAMGQDVLLNWTVVNKTTNAAVALTSVAEDAIVDGRYLFVATVAQTNGDVLNFKYLSASFEADFDVTITI
jgi:hypothetical protein